MSSEPSEEELLRQKEYRGIDQDNLVYNYNTTDKTFRWVIHPNAHLPDMILKFESIDDKFKEYNKKFEESKISEKEMRDTSRQLHRELLELWLQNFNYDEVIKYVPFITLERIASELRLFLVVNGGQEESKLLGLRLVKAKKMYYQDTKTQQ